MLSLRPLPTETVSRIVSGQIITSAYSVVKELVENALDAEAKSIEIRLDNFGTGLVKKMRQPGLFQNSVILLIYKISSGQAS